MTWIMTFNMMVARRDLYVSPRTRFVIAMMRKRRQRLLMIALDASLGRDIRWPDYI